MYWRYIGDMMSEEIRVPFVRHRDWVRHRD